MHYVLRAVLQIIVGISIAAIGAGKMGRGAIGDSWWDILGLILLFVGLFSLVSGGFLLMREEGALTGPGTYYEYRCPYCGGLKRSAWQPLRGEVKCSFCGKRFRVS